VSGSLDDLRAAINALDRRLLEVLIERAAAARAIGRLKSREARAVFDPGREREVLERLLAENRGRFPPEALTAVVREIVSASRALESPMTVGYLGRGGGFAAWAARRRFGSACALLPFDRPGELFRKLAAGHLDYAIVLREVGDEDPALDAFDPFLDHGISLFGEYLLHGGYALLAAGTGEAPTSLFAHPSALARCHHALAALGPVARVAVADSETAAQRAAAEGAYALAPAPLAGIHGLDVLRETMENVAAPVRRFLILARTPAPRSGRDRTALVVVLADRPGSLQEILLAFATRKVNVAWVEIRESRGRPWEHTFFLEVDGHRDDPPVQEALQEAGEAASHLQVLGSYPLES